jgi:hypothetical protein
MIREKSLGMRARRARRVFEEVIHAARFSVTTGSGRRPFWKSTRIVKAFPGLRPPESVASRNASRATISFVVRRAVVGWLVDV